MKKLIKRMTLTAMCLWLLAQSAFAADLLIPVGQVVGLQLRRDTVTVAAFDENLGINAQKAGLKIGDEIQSINKKEIHTASDVHAVLQQSDGAVEMVVNRDGKSKHLKLHPEITEQGPRLGVFLRDGITGIGTVTWYDPDTGKFGTLGHGVSDGNGDLVEMTQGKAFDADIVSVKKGRCGEPGQLRGAITSDKELGTLYRNTEQGVFGTTNRGWRGEALPVGELEDIHTGAAVIRSTVEGDTPREYSVEILKIYPNSRKDGRNLLLKVTDPALLDATGGIVQGMSGSPICQDGRIVGAVTHVLVNDPTTGYGIFIENMLDAAA